MYLEAKNISVNYGNISAVRDISITVQSGKIVTIVGANGAGKTTVLRALSGLVPLSGGEIQLDGRKMDGLPTEKIVANGIIHVPEGRRIFPDMTVEENLRTGAFLRKVKTEIEKDLDEVFNRFPRLLERRTQRAKTMSGGEQQMLAIGRALMASPKILLLDEPSMGLAPVIVDEIARIIQDINKLGLSVVLVEQNAELALDLSDYGYVLETGNLTLEGPAKELHGNSYVQKAYLGI